VASHVGEMGDRRGGRDPGYHEPFLPDVLLSNPEKSGIWGRKNLSPKTPLAEFFIE
jgi:hypothetical protein